MSLHREAEDHLKKSCPTLRPVIERVGPCGLEPDANLFGVLVRAIVSQLISTAAARTITARLLKVLKGPITPGRVLKREPEELRACGLSNAKVKAIRHLAEHFQTNKSFAKDIAASDDAAARELLLPLPGIGPWTVEMTLMFGLVRPDVLPVGDLGLRAGVRELFNLPDLPDAKALQTLAEPWRPYRTVATWYVWKRSNSQL